MKKHTPAITDCPYFREAWRGGVSSQVIANVYGCNKYTVIRLGHQYGYGPHPKSRGSMDKLKKHQRQVHHAKTSEPDDNPRAKPVSLVPMPSWATEAPQDTERRAWRDRVHSLAGQGKRVTEIARDLQCLPIDVMHEVQRAKP